MLKNVLDGLMEFSSFLYLKSPTKNNIIKILLKNKKPLSIAQIHKKFGKFNYRAIHQHVWALEKKGVVFLSQKGVRGKPVMVYLNPDFRANKKALLRLLSLSVQKKNLKMNEVLINQKRKGFFKELEKWKDCR